MWNQSWCNGDVNICIMRWKNHAHAMCFGLDCCVLLPIDFIHTTQGLYSLSDKSREISNPRDWGVLMIVSLQNLTGISAALLTRSKSNLRAIGKVRTRTSRLLDFAITCGKTSVRLVRRVLGLYNRVGVTRVWFIAVNNESIWFNSNKCNGALFGIASEPRLCQIWSLTFYTVCTYCKCWDGKF